MPAASSFAAVLGGPWVAAPIGVALGVALLALTYAGVKSFTPDTLEVGAMRAVAMMVLGLFLAFGGLLLFYLYVRPGLVSFGLGMVAGFLVPATIALFRMPGVTKHST